MITPQEADTIKQILGYRYAKKVLQKLTKTKKRRKSGTPYSSNDVSQVMCGFRENEDIENAIYNVVKEEQQKQEEELKRRNAILNKKPKAATLGNS